MKSPLLTSLTRPQLAHARDLLTARQQAIPSIQGNTWGRQIPTRTLGIKGQQGYYGLAQRDTELEHVI